MRESVQEGSSNWIGHAGFLAAFALLCTVIAGCGGGSSPPPAPPPIIASQTAVAVADFNGDGRDDMAVSAAVSQAQSALAGEVQLFLHTSAQATFLAPVAYEVGTDPVHLVAGDIDGDGLPDLAVANEASDSVSVLFNRPAAPGTFFSAVQVPCGPAPLAVALGDLNGDGLVDIAVAVADGVDILFQNPSAPGTFLSPTSVTLALQNGTFSVAIGDVDGDHIPDVVASGTDAVYVFFQSGTVAGLFTQPTRVLAGTEPNGVAIEDMDGDGLLDIVVANIGTPPSDAGSSVSVIIQDPAVAGSFLPAVNLVVPNGGRAVVVRDFDGNGLPDIAVASTVLSSTTPGVITLLLQGPVGAFTVPPSYTNGAPLSIAAGDLNLDGFLDVATQDGPSIFFQDPSRPGIFFNEVVVAF